MSALDQMRRARSDHLLLARPLRRGDDCWHFRCGPGADVVLFDYLIGDQQKVAAYIQAKRVGRLQIYYQFEFGRLLDR